MTVCVVYITVTHGAKTNDFCARFCSTWNQHPPKADCDLIVACQGGPLPTETALLFASLKPRFWPRINDGGRDLSAYIEAARTIAKGYDMILALGESVHFAREGWLKRLVEARQRHGPGMYGIWGTHVIRAHLLTTAFFITPSLLASYPLPVTDKNSRYELEHGERALWRRLQSRNMPVKLVTWDSEWSPGRWRVPKNCLWRGDQSGVLMKCNHTERYEAADPVRKRNWEASSNRPFR